MNMNPMTKCNECGKLFSQNSIRLQEKRVGEYVVQYFTCPFCGKKYQVLTTDEEMRALIERKKEIWRGMRLAGQRKGGERTVKRYKKKLIAVDKEIKLRLAHLSELGEDILEGRHG
jgi:transposase-like protein